MYHVSAQGVDEHMTLIMDIIIIIIIGWVVLLLHCCALVAQVR